MIRIAALVLFSCLAPALRSQGLGDPGAPPPRTFDLQHVRLDLSFDRSARRVSGLATLRLAALQDGLPEVLLDGVGLAVAAVSESGRPCAFTNDGRTIRIRAERPLAAGKPVEFSIRYSARPRRGLYFVDSLPDYPGRPAQIYTQGFPQDNRYWFPLYDFPNDKTTSEIVLTVPAGWEVMSNGRLVERRESGGQAVFHWRLDKPHSTYLISFVAGEMDRVEQRWRSLPLVYYVPRGAHSLVPSSFGRTPAALEFLAGRLGPYPWDQYAQCVLEESVYGGMENTGAVTLAPRFLLDPRLAPDEQEDNDESIAHELAHQWLGDLVSFEDFSHLWLSEGFATYAANLWIEHHSGPAEAAWKRHEHARAITGVVEAARFPLVRAAPSDPSDPVALLAYQKGAWMVHMARRRLGDDRFFKAMREWIARYAHHNVRTADLVASIRASTGADLSSLFDQFAFRPGHPALQLSWRWNRGRVLLPVRQKAPLFRIPVDVELFGRGYRLRRTLSLSRQFEEFAIDAPSPPSLVLLDPDQDWLMDVAFEKSSAEWLYQLEHAPAAASRADAAAALVAFPGRAVPALAAAASRDPFWGVRREAVRALSAIRTPAARRAAIAALHDPDFRVRRAALSAAARDPRALPLLLDCARRDPSFTVRADAIRALAAVPSPRRFESLRPFLQQESPRHVLAAAALAAISSIHGARAASVLLLWSAPGMPVEARVAALHGLGDPANGGPLAFERLVQALGSAAVDVRTAAIAALRRRADPRAIPVLERAARQDPLEDLGLQAARAAAAIQSISRKPASAGSPRLP